MLFSLLFSVPLVYILHLSPFWILISALFSILPDADKFGTKGYLLFAAIVVITTIILKNGIILVFLLFPFAVKHRSFTHSVGFVFVVSLILGIAVPPLGIFAFLGLLSHLLADKLH